MYTLLNVTLLNVEDQAYYNEIKIIQKITYLIFYNTSVLTEDVMSQIYHLFMHIGLMAYVQKRSWNLVPHTPVAVDAKHSVIISYLRWIPQHRVSTSITVLYSHSLIGYYLCQQPPRLGKSPRVPKYLFKQLKINATNSKATDKYISDLVNTTNAMKGISYGMKIIETINTTSWLYVLLASVAFCFCI